MHARWLVGQWSMAARGEAVLAQARAAIAQRPGRPPQRCHHVADDLAQLSDLSAQVGKLAVEFISLGEKRIELLELNEI